MRDAGARPRRWKARPALALALRTLIVLVPAAAAVGVTALARPLVPLPRSLAGRVGWWVALIGLGVGVAMLVERVARRLLPLVMLLKLSMLFPDRVPSRFAVAREAGSVRKLKARLAELEEEPSAQDDAWSAQQILALAMALQSHDRQTRGHSERVRVFTDLLAAEMKIPHEDRDRLRWAALLHDIGKLTVDAAILNKPAKLDEDEWEAIKRHPAEGLRIAAPLIEWLGPWSGAISEHHERFDGAGYPHGLAQQGISPGGRMVAVADSFDTMTAARSYKKPMAVVAARAELARCAGGQFDPAAVRAFLSISLPVLLWKTGPLAFLMQLPFLSRMRLLAQEAVSAATQGLAAGAVAAGVTAAALSPTPSPSLVAAGPSRPPAAVVAPAAPMPAPSPGASSLPSRGEGPRGGGPGGGAEGPPDGSPSPSPSEEPTGGLTGNPDGGPLPLPLPSLSPLPLPLPLPSPSPLPLPSPPPLPLPSPSLPPLPLPSPSLPLGNEPESNRGS